MSLKDKLFVIECNGNNISWKPYDESTKRLTQAAYVKLNTIVKHQFGDVGLNEPLMYYIGNNIDLQSAEIDKIKHCQLNQQLIQTFWNILKTNPHMSAMYFSVRVNCNKIINQSRKTLTRSKSSNDAYSNTKSQLSDKITSNSEAMDKCNQAIKTLQSLTDTGYNLAQSKFELIGNKLESNGTGTAMIAMNKWSAAADKYNQTITNAITECQYQLEYAFNQLSKEFDNRNSASSQSRRSSQINQMHMTPSAGRQMKIATKSKSFEDYSQPIARIVNVTKENKQFQRVADHNNVYTIATRRKKIVQQNKTEMKQSGMKTTNNSDNKHSKSDKSGKSKRQKWAKKIDIQQERDRKYIKMIRSLFKRNGNMSEIELLDTLSKEIRRSSIRQQVKAQARKEKARLQSANNNRRGHGNYNERDNRKIPTIRELERRIMLSDYVINQIETQAKTQAKEIVSSIKFGSLQRVCTLEYSSPYKPGMFSLRDEYI